jgi:hypothetical protein
VIHATFQSFLIATIYFITRRFQMKHFKTNLIFLALGAFLAFGSIGCEDKGPMEKAGEKMDEAAEDAADTVEEAVDKAKE